MSEPDLRGLFAQEASGLLERLSAGALELEAAGDADLVASLFRAAHTLKGSAALVGFDDVAATAHVLEDVLDGVRAGRLQPAAPVVDALLGTVDALRQTIPRLLAGQDAGPAHVEAAHRLRAVAAGEAPVATPPAAAQAHPEPPRGAAIPVPLDRLDRLVRVAGEGRTARLRLAAALGPAATADPDVDAALAEVERALAALQRETLEARMVTLERIAEPLRRAARDVARTTGKDVDYALQGGRVELDRAVLDALREPLLHLVRNAVDHGIEPPGERAAAGKPPAGTVRVTAHRRGADLVVEVSDDGRGLDPVRLRDSLPGSEELADADVVDHLFAPGVSTAAAVTDVSGRGVGLDVVRTAMGRVRGTVTAHGEPGRGATFTLAVPVTLEVVRCLLVAVGGERYAIPAHAVAALHDAGPGDLVALEGGQAVWSGDDLVPVVALAEVVGAAGAGTGGHAVVLASGGHRVGVCVDALLGQREVTLQELGRVVGGRELVAGAAIDADGSVLLVLDCVTLTSRAAARRGQATVTDDGDAGPRASVLIVDDALTVRELQRSILERAGYAVELAEDGAAALAALDRWRPDLVLTDVEMPRLDGFALVEAIRARPELASLPVLIVTSRAEEADRRRGLEAGADGYLVKQAFDERALLRAVARVLGEEDPL